MLHCVGLFVRVHWQVVTPALDLLASVVKLNGEAVAASSDGVAGIGTYHVHGNRSVINGIACADMRCGVAYCQRGSFLSGLLVIECQQYW